MMQRPETESMPPFWKTSILSLYHRCMDKRILQKLFLPILMMVGYGCIVFIKVNLGTIFTCVLNLQGTDDFVNKTEDAIMKKSVLDANLIDRSDRNILLSVEFWAYLIFALPAGYFADKISLIALITLMFSNYALCTFLFPLAYSNFYTLFGLLFMIGLSESMVNPLFDSLIGKYVYVKDKALAISIYTSGVQISGALGGILIPLICQSNFKWTTIFYAITILSLYWLVIFSCYWHKSFKKKHVLDEKKNHLTDTVLIIPTNKKLDKILVSFQFISCVLCNFANCMLIVLIQTYIPIFIQEVKHFPLVLNGISNSLQYIVQLSCKLIWSSAIVNILENKFSHKMACKYSQIIASLLISIPLLLIANLIHLLHEVLFLCLLFLIAIGMGISLSGYYTFLLSLSPENTGLLSSIANIIGTIGCLILPYLFVILQVDKLLQWYIVFTTVGLIHGITSFLFVLYCK